MSDTTADIAFGRKIVQVVEESRPDLVRLATAVSLASRIEPALLRRVRFRLLPELHVSTEAELWFSPLVSSYSPRALVLHPGVASVLRQRLERDQQQCRAARAIIAQLHAQAAPTIRLEEDVRFAAMTGQPAEVIDVQLGRALNTIKLDSDRADRIARWVVGAWPLLPERARAGEVASKLIATSRLRLAPGVTIGVELDSRGIVVSEPAVVTSHAIDLPAADPGRPLQIRIAPVGSEKAQKTIVVGRDAINHHRIADLDATAPAVEIETADGRVFEVRGAARARRSAPQLDLADIQGDILHAYNRPRAVYLFISLGDAEAARTWLGRLIDDVTTAAPWDTKPPTTLNVALTAAGLVALGVPDATVDTFSEPFRQGMAARHELLGDVGASDPSSWEFGLGTSALHVLLTIKAKDPAALAEAVDRTRAGASDVPGLRMNGGQEATALPHASEHFGFAHGFAQPAIEGVSEDRVAGGGVPLAGGRWRALAPGEFILGYHDENTRIDRRGRLPVVPAPLGRNGTYMVWRKLSQDVALFRRTLGEAASRYAASDEELLYAKVAGRWRDGTALVLNPAGLQAAGLPGMPPGGRPINDFRYLDQDADGFRCPLGAHTRRANPRDALGRPGLRNAGRLSHRHRIIRRSMPYGEPLPPDAIDDDGADRGLVFVCFNASISRQFESIQTQWMNDGNALGLGHDSDFLVSHPLGTGKMTVQGEPPFLLSPQGPFVTTRGGEYLFVPGIRALRALADGPDDRPA